MEAHKDFRGDHEEGTRTALLDPTQSHSPEPRKLQMWGTQGWGEKTGILESAVHAFTQAWSWQWRGKMGLMEGRVCVWGGGFVIEVHG